MNTIPEANLPALAAGKAIAKIRAIDADGNPVNATPAQAATAIAPMLGIDKSILTEQIIPGEFFINSRGNRLQIYTKTVVSSFPSTLNGAMGVNGVVISVEGVIDCYSTAYNEPLWVANTPAKFRDAGVYGVYYDIPASLYGKSYRLTFKYAR